MGGPSQQARAPHRQSRAPARAPVRPGSGSGRAAVMQLRHSRFVSLGVLVVAAALLTTTVQPARAESFAQKRGGWFLGFGVGGGSAGVSDNSGSRDREGSVGASFRVG